MVIRRWEGVTYYARDSVVPKATRAFTRRGAKSHYSTKKSVLRQTGRVEQLRDLRFDLIDRRSGECVESLAPAVWREV